MPQVEHPAVSVVLPVYNGACFVEDAIASVLNQQGWDIDLIAVDDASADDSAALLQRLAAGEPRIRVLKQDVNRGVAVARNRALAASSAPLVAFIDQDDLWTPDRLDVAWGALCEEPALDFVLAHQRLFTTMNERPGWVRPRWLEAPQPAFIFGTMLGWRARCWETIGMLDEELRMGDDTDWFVRAKDRGLRSRILPDVLLERRIHAANASTNTRRSTEELFTLLRRRQSATKTDDA